MSASPETKVQINYRGAEPPLVNIYATSARELSEILSGTDWALVAAAGADYAAAFELSSGLGARPAPQDNVGTSVEGGNCPHGARVYKSGNGKRGKWEGFFCPTRAQGCEPVWKDK